MSMGPGVQQQTQTVAASAQQPLKSEAKGRCKQCISQNVEVCTHCFLCEQPVTQNTSNSMNEIGEKRDAQLIGSRCMITCQLNGVQTQMLLDSGAQVSIVGRVWLKKCLPNINIQPLESLLADSQLHVTAANGTAVPFDGWVED